MKKIILLGFILMLTRGAFCGNPGLGLKSAIVPGMGQISAGSGSIQSLNTLRGLGIMSGFVFCLHGTLNSISERESYAEQTQYYADNIKANYVSGTHSDLVKYTEAHKKAYDNYKTANALTFVYLGLTAAFYGYGIVDALMFTKEDDKKRENAAFLHDRINVTVTQAGQGSGVRVNYRF
jgi:hypothetical protein